MSSIPFFESTAYPANSAYSFTTSPRVGQADPHMVNANAEVAFVSGVAADFLQQIVSEDLDVVSDTNAPTAARERARARILAAVSVVNSASNAVTSIAEAETAQANLVSPENLDVFKESRPGAADSQGDRLSQFLNVQFGTARTQMMDAVEQMESDPALATVLARRNYEGGVPAFFKRISAAAVSLGALASRATALPGLIRQSIVRGLDRADDAVINATDKVIQRSMDVWHEKVGVPVDNLKAKAAEQVESFISDTKADVREIGDWTQARAKEVSSAAQAVSETTKAVAREKIVEPAQRAAFQARYAADLTGATLESVAAVASSRISGFVSGFYENTVRPALDRFASDVKQQIDQRITKPTRMNSAGFSEVADAQPAAPAPSAPRLS